MKRQHIPTRTPLIEVHEVGFHRGRRILEASYASATEMDEQGQPKIWRCNFDDSGHVIGCSCRALGPCWHSHDAPAAVVEYFKQARGNMNERQLADQAEHLQRYLGYPLDADDREAAELEAIAVRQLRAAKQEAA